MYYYLLVNNFGGVPLVTEYAKQAGEIKEQPRATAEAVYTHIITELTNIIDNNKLVASSATKGGGEASIEAVKALLAKNLLVCCMGLKER